MQSMDLLLNHGAGRLRLQGLKDKTRKNKSKEHKKLSLHRTSIFGGVYAEMEGVISVFRSKTLQLHTTRSWDFVGFTLGNNKVTPLQLAFGDDIVVGMFDTGIWPESESFSEEPRMKPIPSTWRGECVKGDRFDPKTNCNRKLIGARYYLKGFEEENGPLRNPEYQSSRDFLGHGTHTASTAVGSIVKNASFFGLGLGTARGGAPRARLAVYKICWANEEFNSVCSEIDILAAFDDALHDGVHIISASFGPRPPMLPLFETSAGIGSFHAMQLGITVAFSAGNEGPDPSLVTNVAPWSISVAASSVDRMFRTQILVDSSLSIMGESFLPTEIKGKLADPSMYFEHGVCNSDNYMNESKPAVGKVVVCFSTDGPTLIDHAVAAVKTANALGLIFVEPMTRQTADVEIVPTVYVNFEQGTQIKNYLYESPSLPRVRIMPTKTIIGKSPAPTVADFSSRGPSSLTPDILKPDVTAPGVSILAAWPHDTSPTLSPSDDRRVRWNFQSGTSMSCPHVSGVAALIKSAHPRWSPSAIRSALITTAYTRDTTSDSILAGGSMKVADPFDIGAGHINPLKALDPGLVYEMKTSDYILFLCNIGYTQENIHKMVLPCPGVDISCPKVPKSNTNINYPSITVSNLKSTMTIKRTVRNVGHKKNTIYFASIVKPDGVEVFIWPRALIFSWFNEENSYYVTLKPLKKSQGRYDFGEIVWSDGCHKVRSPLVVCVNTTDDSSDSIARTSSSI
ncbi:subtilisin-like protease SBT3.18 isoform X6 [Juglans microcarpa x Juglans regia]|uniref:subtilisin-like protease SBT3.18 isoform X6 n=1 Tax=Juglans microcarpa x Juglans regia TaxID=2249226 RepID=UPI001B7DEFDE|nr:subtilisin-like protease SBT3.18 isoform X6 [Juglans microcarpa x Juglans regia]